VHPLHPACTVPWLLRYLAATRVRPCPGRCPSRSLGYLRMIEKLPSKGCGRGDLQTAPTPTPRGTFLVGKHKAKQSALQKTPEDRAFRPLRPLRPTGPRSPLAVSCSSAHPPWALTRAPSAAVGDSSNIKHLHFWHWPGFIMSIFTHRNQMFLFTAANLAIRGTLCCQPSFPWD